MSKKTTLVLFLIIFIAVLLRFWRLGEVPPSPNWDEVALGYNAYSIAETGKDEHGKTLPIVLRSYDDYKPALYAYLVSPFIKIFGLEVFAVRLPSAIFGILTVIATFFLTKEIFKKVRIALLASFLLAISPWHVQFSRIAFEANVGLALNVFAALFFVKGLRRPWLLIVSALFMGLNLYAYQSEKVFTPLLLVVLIAAFRKDFFSIPKKFLLAAVIVGFIISFPMIYYILTSGEALSRAQGVSVFSDQTEFLKNNVIRIAEDQKNKDIIGLVLDNRRFVYLKSIISGYLSHFDLNWLFMRGDIARHHAPGMGLLYLWELPFLLIGIYQLIFGRFDKGTKLLVLGWFLIAPVAASITSGVPHAVRTLNFLPTFQVFVAIGILFSISNIKIQYLIFNMYFLFLIFNFLYYLNQYFVQQNYFVSQDWQYGYKEAVAVVKETNHLYEKIVVSNKPYLDQSYMFFLFYLRYPPADYYEQARSISGGFREDHAYGKFEFRPIDWEKEHKSKKTLFVGKPEDFPVTVSEVKIIKFLDGKPAIKIVEGSE